MNFKLLKTSQIASLANGGLQRAITLDSTLVIKVESIDYTRESCIKNLNSCPMVEKFYLAFFFLMSVKICFGPQMSNSHY